MTAMQRFGARLAKHLRDGTRPPGSKRTGRWGKAEFGKAVERGDRIVTLWCKGNNLPPDFEPLECALFGKDASKDDDNYRAWRSELRTLFDAAKEEKAARTELKQLEKVHARRASLTSIEAGEDAPAASNVVSPEPLAGASITGNIPRVPRLFLGRESTLDAIHAILSDCADRDAAVVLYGLGGVGKTSIAAAYYQRCQTDYIASHWIRAETIETIIEDYVASGLAEVGDQQNAPLRWLVRPGPDTLLIYDNAEDARLLTAYLPPHGGARILVTSNDHAWESIGTPIEISTWSRETGADFLTSRSGQRDTPRDVAEKLSTLLGGLPLAHEQAAAFCEKLSVSLADYSRRFEAQPVKLLGDEKYAPIEHRRSVAKTFEIAIDAATTLHPAAGQFILLISQFGPNPVPLFIFDQFHNRLSYPLKSAVQNGSLEEVIAALRSFSLIDVEKGRPLSGDGIRSISLHRLVRMVVLEICEPALRQSAKMISLDLLRDATMEFPSKIAFQIYHNNKNDDIPPLERLRFRGLFPIVTYLVEAEGERDSGFVELHASVDRHPAYYLYD